MTARKQEKSVLLSVRRASVQVFTVCRSRQTGLQQMRSRVSLYPFTQKINPNFFQDRSVSARSTKKIKDFISFTE